MWILLVGWSLLVSAVHQDIRPQIPDPRTSDVPINEGEDSRIVDTPIFVECKILEDGKLLYLVPTTENYLSNNMITGTIIHNRIVEGALIENLYPTFANHGAVNLDNPIDEVYPLQDIEPGQAKFKFRVPELPPFNFAGDLVVRFKSPDDGLFYEACVPIRRDLTVIGGTRVGNPTSTPSTVQAPAEGNPSMMTTEPQAASESQKKGCGTLSGSSKGKSATGTLILFIALFASLGFWRILRRTER